MEIFGIPASPGKKWGKVFIIKGNNLPKVESSISNLVIAVEDFADLGLILKLRNASAFISKTGGRTSHAASIVRELGVPYVSGLGDDFYKLKRGDYVLIDGFEGKIIIEERS